MRDQLLKLNSLTGWDCHFSSFDGYRLVLSSGSSNEYATPLVAFLGVSYMHCPFEFSHPVFRLGTEKESLQVEQLSTIEEGERLFVIEAETQATLDKQLFFIVAEGLDLIGMA
ncbi:hypothetical protein L2750_10845 [Shewanella submarina]|uniref:Uncharacterized protein n=1 Tax=Shewanella submarina TaxID=2016376 RepID=A0ABV7GAY9_9GAMM|nr:hypothetical protein [Shewanella submarina]MCL1037647.1 hypothetical protein [Shewanella submarina]